ncbi:MAG TPA: hypothetical protein VH369_11395 [Bryobacteraceae bacterium]|jgi:hypothetical protein
MRLKQRISKYLGMATRLVKPAVPFVLCLAVAAVRCSAATSPFARWIDDLRLEATGTWAVGGAVIGLIIGLLGLKFGGHEAKSKFASLAITAFALLSVEGIVAYLQSE